MNKPNFNLSHANEAFIERIVKEVVRRLKNTAYTAGQASSGTRKNNVVGQASTLSITAKVITLADLEGKLAAATQVAVPSGAIVTPAVRDELRRHNIALVRGENVNAQSVDSTTLHIATAGISYQAKGVAANHIGSFEQISEAVKQLADKVKNNNQAILLTNDPHAAACLANRHNNLQAIAARSANEIEQARQSIGCNFAAVNPAEVNPFMLKKIAAELVVANNSKPTYFHQLAGDR